MKSVIIIPPSSFLDSDRVFPHLGPYYIKRFVEENSTHKVFISYREPYDINFDEIDIVGFSSTTPQYPSVLNILKIVPKNCITVIGGSHAKNYPIEEDKIWDYIIKGDGCHPFLNLLNGNELGNELDDPNQLPHRDRSFFDYKYYLDGNPTTVIITSRGCPNSCAFCEHANTLVRLKKPEYVKKEIQEIVKLGFTGIMFFDDLFCLNTKRVRNLCAIIKPFNIKFRCFAHARNFNEEMACLLADSGCIEIGYGAEHVVQKILDTVNKRTSTKQNYEIINIAHRHGIRVKAFLLLGLPGENNATAKELEKFVLTSGIDDYDVGIYFPYKGTTIADNIDAYDIFLETKNNALGYYKGKLGFAECLVHTSEITSNELKMWRERIYSHNKRWNKK